MKLFERQQKVVEKDALNKILRVKFAFEYPFRKETKRYVQPNKLNYNFYNFHISLIKYSVGLTFKINATFLVFLQVISQSINFWFFVFCPRFSRGTSTCTHCVKNRYGRRHMRIT